MKTQILSHDYTKKTADRKYGEKKKNSDEKIQNTSQIVMGYDVNSYVAIIKNQEEIKQLENLFNNAEFYKSDTAIQQPYLRISFSGDRGSITFYIDNNDVIQLGEENYIKSKQISFEKLYSIFHKYSSEK